MRILNGWKEIAECLHRTPRSARRWERLGLPVKRVSNSRRSPVIALSDEIERWVQMRRTSRQQFGALKANLEANIAAFMTTLRQTGDLVEELRSARLEHRSLLNAIRESNGRALKASANI